MAITIYGNPGCWPCKKTIAKFEEAGITPEYVDLSQDQTAQDRFVAAGWMQAPVVIQCLNGDQLSQWAGLDPTKIASAIAVEQDANR